MKDANRLKLIHKTNHIVEGEVESLTAVSEENEPSHSLNDLLVSYRSTFSLISTESVWQAIVLRNYCYYFSFIFLLVQVFRSTGTNCQNLYFSASFIQLQMPRWGIKTAIL